MFLSYLQTDELFIVLNLKIWTLVAENYLDIEDVLKFESLEDGKGKKTAFGWLVQECKMFVCLEMWQKH